VGLSTVQEDMTTRADSRGAESDIRDAAVVTWRRTQLLAGGFGLTASESLARDCGVDLHALLDLVERGCPPRLAMRIIAPLEGESRRC
jgi:hypothetical protein